MMRRHDRFRPAPRSDRPSASIAWALPLFIAALALGCGGDEASKRPLGASCESDEVCLSGLCGGGICLDPDEDNDLDGLTNAIEAALGSNPLAADSDGDGVADADELEPGSVDNADTDGDGLPDILESRVADQDGDCITDQFDSDNETPSTDPSPMVKVVCRLDGICGANVAALAVSCASGAAVCVYDGVPGYADPESSCDGEDDNCDGAVDEAFSDRDDDAIADCVDDDWDNDGVVDGDDVCPSVADPTQDDGDGDGVGDACAARYAYVFGEEPSSVVVGVPFELSLTLAELEVTGESPPLPTRQGPVTLALDSALEGVALSGTLTVEAAEIAHFEGLVVTNPAEGLVLVASAPGLSESRSAELAATTDGVNCLEGAHCASGVCADAGCVEPSCDDEVHNGAESDTDCGGGECPACAPGGACVLAGDCDSGVCGDDGRCAEPSCGDEVVNGGESGVDCGGETGCARCAPGATCAAASDCDSGVCEGGLCAAPSCEDEVRNGDEPAADCGGSACEPCADGAACNGPSDCASGVCDGGTCAVPSCEDEVVNGLESGVDCGGGSSCGACADGKGCAVPADCVSGVCEGGVCAAPSCEDEVANGLESGVDCGAASGCGLCGTGGGCGDAADCDSGVCGRVVPGECSAPACDDGVINGDETEVDCGPDSICGPCTVVCDGPEDCASGQCDESRFCSLVGTWRIHDDRNGLILVTVLEDFSYVHAEYGDDAVGAADGIEVGSFTWDRDSGAFQSACPTVDTNGDWGLSHLGGGLSCPLGGDGTKGTLEVDGDSLALDVGGTVLTGSRIVGESPLVGTWRLDFAETFVFFTFMADGIYLHAEYDNPDPSGQDGLEAGTYTWNETSGAFSSACPFVDTNGQWGLSHPSGDACTGSFATVEVDGDALVFGVDGEGFTGTRVVAPAP